MKTQLQKLEQKAIDAFMEWLSTYKQENDDPCPDESELYEHMKMAADDVCIPEESRALLELAFVEPWLATDEVEDYSEENALTPASLLYENLYRHLLATVEEHYDSMEEE